MKSLFTVAVLSLAILSTPVQAENVNTMMRNFLVSKGAICDKVLLTKNAQVLNSATDKGRMAAVCSIGNKKAVYEITNKRTGRILVKLLTVQ